MHRSLVILSFVPRLAGVVLKLAATGGGALVRLAAARRRGLRGFRQGLAEAGLPQGNRMRLCWADSGPERTK